MPRNPDKMRCTVPGCRNWAMRGHERCRSHLDAQRGPRRAGAPLANLNALRTGEHSQPLSLPEREQLVAEVIAHPDTLPLHLARAVSSVHARTGDPFLTLVALRCLLAQLIPLLAACLFRVELRAYLYAAARRLMPADESQAAGGEQDAVSALGAASVHPLLRDVQTVIERKTARQAPEERLLLLRKIIRHRNNYRNRDRADEDFVER
jgi:hypothetical protein